MSCKCGREDCVGEESCKCGDSCACKIDDRVDEWHKGDSELPLHEYLGMTWEEYSDFVTKPS